VDQKRKRGRPKKLPIGDNPQNIQKHLIASDFHVPDFSRESVDALLRFIPVFKPDFLHILGDFVNFTGVSRYDADPYYDVTVADEIDVGRSLLEKIVRTAREVNPKVRIYWFEGNHECFDDKTEILTKDGWKKHDQITKDTVLGTYDKEKNVVEWEKPIAIQRYKVSEKLISIKGQNTDLLITKNHRLYYRCNTNSKWKTKPFSEMTVGNNRIVFKVSATEGNSEYPITDDLIRATAWLLTDCHIGSNTVTFYQRKSKSYIVENILQSLNWSYTRRERYRNITHICGKLLKTHEPEVSFNLLGDSRWEAKELVSDRNRIPEWVGFLSDRQFEIFLSSFVDADGSRHKSSPDNSWMVYRSKDVLDQLQILCFLHGFRTSIFEYRSGNFRLNITKNETTAFDGFSNYVKEEKYSGLIWDVTTPNDTVIVRRNNKISITGNSRLTKFLGKSALPLAGLNVSGEKVISIPHLFELSALGVEWVPSYKHKRVGDFVFQHGYLARVKAGFTAQAMIDKLGMSGFQGHTHRLALVSRTQYGISRFFIETGCMCSLEPDPPYMINPDWTAGFAIGVLENGKFYPQIMPIIDGKVLYGSILV
jgi:hypothetical protein